MSLLHILFPANFWLLALSHFVALLSPGPDFFLLSGYALRYRMRGSAGVCVGIAAGNAGYIVLAIAGWSGLTHFPQLFGLTALAGAGYLLWIGWQLSRSKPCSRPPEAVSSLCPSFLRQFASGLASSALNPKNALFYLALMTTVTGPDITAVQQISCGVWMVMVVLLWDLAIVGLLGLSAVRKRLSGVIWRLERMAGGVLILFAMIIIIRWLAGGVV